MLTTIEDIAHDYVSTLSEEDKQYVRNRESLDPINKVWLRSSIGREIRNEYGLWSSNPLTEKWRTDQSSRLTIDGIDHSTDHPDQVSALILNRVFEIID